MLAGLAHAETLEEAARAYYVSRATLTRYLQQARAEVRLPAASELRLSPPMLSIRLLQALEQMAPAR